MKDVTVRINDTLGFIQTSAIGTFAENACAHALATSYIQNHYPPANAHQPGYVNFSNGMSMKNVHNAGNETQREMRRAIYLLWHAIGNNALANRATTLGAGLLAAEYRRLLQKARIVEDAHHARDHGSRNLLTTVIPAAPLQFLTDNKIMVRGSTAYAPDALDRNLVNFYFTYDAAQDRYMFVPVAGFPVPAGAYGFSAASVRAVHWTAVPGRGIVVNPGPPPGAASFGAIDGTRLDGSDVMVTTQFTGCSFCMKDVGGVIYGAHISPSIPGHPNPHVGPTMAQQLCGMNANVGAGDFANHAGAAPFMVYGAGHSNIPGFPNGYPVPGAGANPLQYMCMIGVRVGGIWQIFSQQVFAGGAFAAFQVL
ncbi:hypothetical protein [Paraburkholderia sp. BR14320]|uniref:hypothetical protein n=1 Tax=unclassified Paraburkholderia TaxID=2615204 RepID=UPI0034CFC26F